MCSRTFSALLLLLVGCDQSRDVVSAEADDVPTVPCALDGAAAFTEQCAIVQKGGYFVLTAPDGGFRRLYIDNGLAEPADGAEPANVTFLKDMVEVRIGDDAYRLEASIKDGPNGKTYQLVRGVE